MQNISIYNLDDHDFFEPALDKKLSLDKVREINPFNRVGSETPPSMEK